MSMTSSKALSNPWRSDLDGMEDLDLDAMELYEKARQGLSQTLYEEES